jgi:hypothetical protein
LVNTQRQIATAFKDTAIAWDEEQPNLDFDNRGKDNVLSWLDTWKQLKMMECLVTYGWSNSVAATNLAYKMDFISYHVIEHLEYETNLLIKTTKTCCNWNLACLHTVVFWNFGRNK